MNQLEEELESEVNSKQELASKASKLDEEVDSLSKKLKSEAEAKLELEESKKKLERELTKVGEFF